MCCSYHGWGHSKYRHRDCWRSSIVCRGGEFVNNSSLGKQSPGAPGNLFSDLATHVFTAAAYLLLEQMSVHSSSVILALVPDKVNPLYSVVEEKQPR